jgi:hypothetical protein
VHIINQVNIREIRSSGNSSSVVDTFIDPIMQVKNTFYITGGAFPLVGIAGNFIIDFQQKQPSC